MKNVKPIIMFSCVGFATFGFSQAVQPVAPQPIVPAAAQTAQAQADQLRAQAAQLQAQAAQLEAQAKTTLAQPIQQTNPLAGLISMADAKRIALAAAGIAETDARNFKVELDNEGPLMVYEVEFNSGFHEYEYKIDARSGTIVGTKKKLDLF